MDLHFQAEALGSRFGGGQVTGDGGVSEEEIRNKLLALSERLNELKMKNAVQRDLDKKRHYEFLAAIDRAGARGGKGQSASRMSPAEKKAKAAKNRAEKRSRKINRGNGGRGRRG